MGEWVRYLEALQRSDQSAGVHEVASRVDAMGFTAESAAYLERVMAANSEKSRVFEVCWDLWALLTGEPA
jgi:hypothetical protein